MQTHTILERLTCAGVVVIHEVKLFHVPDLLGELEDLKLGGEAAKVPDPHGGAQSLLHSGHGGK